ncbi:MAG: DNA/RNA nuclease SfsA [bacterium]|nr:DNA/RNA nuclease SfsA [bacterium]
MKIKQKTAYGKLLKRYKRFLADVELEADGTQITAHCPDPGSMLTVAQPGRRVLLAQYSDSGRKLPYGLELIRGGRCWIGVHPGRANAIVSEALIEQRIPELAGYAEHRGEAYFESEAAADLEAGPRTRFDFLLSAGARRAKDCFLEVKSVTMMRRGEYAFPDSVTLRGQRHLRALIAAKRAGYRAVLLFLVQRSDGRCLRLAEDIDPEYARLAAEALRAGVEFLVYGTRIRVGQETLSISLREGRIDFVRPRAKTAKTAKAKPFGQGAGRGSQSGG